MEGKGKLKVNMMAKDQVKQVTISDVMFVPGMEQTLISVGRLIQKGVVVDFNKLELREGNTVVADIISHDHSVFTIKTKPREMAYVGATVTWHEKLGHAGKAKVEAIVKQFNLKGKVTDEDCDICGETKVTREPFPPSKNLPEKEVLDLIHSDLCGT